jgi:hypothetical protein
MKRCCRIYRENPDRDYQSCPECRADQRRRYYADRERRLLYMRDYNAIGREVCPTCSQVIQPRLQRRRA